MAGVVFIFFLLAMAGGCGASWCTCKNGLGDSFLQKTLDYACGHGADCTLIHEAGSCYQPNTVLDHCSYAVNSYFQKYNQQPQACDFAGAANIINTDPSRASACRYPASAGSTSTPTTTTTTTPLTPPTNGMGTTTGSGTGTSTGGPFVTPSTGGVIGGANGLGPTTDMSHGGARLPFTILLCSSTVVAFATLVFW